MSEVKFENLGAPVAGEFAGCMAWNEQAFLLNEAFVDPRDLLEALRLDVGEQKRSSVNYDRRGVSDFVESLRGNCDA